MTYGKSYKGFFNPKNPKKYNGDSTNIIYRSTWELRVMKWLDNHPNVIWWNSEELIIPYRSPVDNKMHRYFPDFIIKLKESNEDIKTYVIEVKPKRQTLPPKQKSRVTKSYLYEVQTYAVNQSKWNAADEWCKDRRLEFKVITETELGLR